MDEAVDPANALRRLVDGFQVSQAISVAAALGIADLLAGGARASDDLAEAVGAHGPSLYRLLRALATEGVLCELDGRRFELTALGDGLRTDADGSIAGWAAFIGRPAYWAAWGHLLHSVRTGENAFTHVHGVGVWAYRAERPEESAAFDQAMVSRAGRSFAAAVAAGDFSRFSTIVDVGGGVGALLAAVLATAPAARGVLFDLPHVVTGARPVLDRAGVSDRCDVVGGSFFDAVPAGADAYVLRAVLHDWEDDDAVRILRVVRRSMAAGGTVLVIERVLGEPNEGRKAAFSDLNMLVAPGGQERSEGEFVDLFARAGLRHTRTVGAGEHCVLEARPATP